MTLRVQRATADRSFQTVRESLRASRQGNARSSGGGLTIAVPVEAPAAVGGLVADAESVVKEFETEIEAVLYVLLLFGIFTAISFLVAAARLVVALGICGEKSRRERGGNARIQRSDGD